MKPIRTYFGSKNGAGVAQQIINEIRPHDVYIEPFLGSGAVYLNKKKAEYNWLNDLDKGVVDKWVDFGIKVNNRDAISYLDCLSWQPELQYCLYLDPPYPKQSRRSTVDVYNYEISDEQHVQLLRVITQLPSNVDVLISTYKNPMYAGYLHDWKLKQFMSQTRQGMATELLYMNYDNLAGVLHDYRFLGQDRTDRQRIRRKVSREISRLSKLPAKERNAIMDGLRNSWSVD